jgi:glycosyltransferase involved in cell wall biosynthesis
MKYSQAIIQPSLFEGWSTVIEDAISLQVPVIASDLPVNIEQLGDRGFFFSPHDAEGLARLLSNFSNPHGANLYGKYDVRIRHFARTFINIFENKIA